tara:strand:- start:25 stop:189 length:165 start_codon:yes stop_codon:yes gene_type:complete
MPNPQRISGDHGMSSFHGNYLDLSLLLKQNLKLKIMKEKQTPTRKNLKQTRKNQ